VVFVCDGHGLVVSPSHAELRVEGHDNAGIVVVGKFYGINVC
jgi:hypothetical protein